MTRFGLKESVIEGICAVFCRYPQVQQAILYGSRAKGNHKPGSDIDLTLLGSPDLSDSILAQIAWEIDDLLLPYTVDLSAYDHITNPNLRAHIQRVGMVFYARKEESESL